MKLAHATTNWYRNLFLFLHVKKPQISIGEVMEQKPQAWIANSSGQYEHQPFHEGWL